MAAPAVGTDGAAGMRFYPSLGSHTARACLRGVHRSEGQRQMVKHYCRDCVDDAQTVACIGQLLPHTPQRLRHGQ